ncbi:GNAT family N-acetyltransferase [Billgrantia endophytica]|uniref:GNAT family N-acetyltransferase n=1 Tax=Billgrantia endophytica TaxID=2033802 RepID=A0A2N7U804_9GAMM|nr:GNAT family N-acetyltransferase [Halomonas endophytica]PMR76558.1 GNAT family N-acetyltransferase [Halomonas endophytica]
MTVRPARLDDLPQLSELLDGYRCFYGQPSDLEAARHFLAQRLELGDSHVLVSEDSGNQLQGFVQLYPLFTTVRLASLWVLNDLFVAPQARRFGTGRALMKAAQELAQRHGVRQLKLATQIENRTAKSLYESLGWQRDLIFDHYSLLLEQK